MGHGDGLSQLYAKNMAYHPYGYALYKPLSSKILKPGSCGYFDAMGDWNPIVDLTSPASLQKYGLSAPKEELERIPADESTSWGPKLSQSVTETHLDLSAGFDTAAAGLPIRATAAVKYRTASNFGAVLATTPPIKRDGYYFESPFRNWFRDNVKALMASPRADEVQKNNIFVVTGTYTTAKCSLAVWTEPLRDVVLGFDVGASGVGKIRSGLKWFDTGSAGGWNQHEGTSGDLLVVFCSGTMFKTRKLVNLVTTKVVKTVFRSSQSRAETLAEPQEEIMTIDVGNSEGYEVLYTNYAGSALEEDDDEDEDDEEDDDDADEDGDEEHRKA